MSDVGWRLEKCEPNAIVQINIDYDELAEDLAETLDQIARLKLNQNLSAIRVLLPDSNRRFEHHHEKAIDSVASLLKANTNIKNLKVENLFSYAAHVRAKTYLLETLTNGEAGDNLVYLWDDFNVVSTDEADALQKYMQMSHNLRRLRIHVDEGPTSLQLVSGLSRTNITELCVEVWPYRGMADNTESLLQAIGEVTSHVPNLTDIAFENVHYSMNVRKHLLDMIKTSTSIATVHVNGASASLQDSTVDSFCILNRVFGTNLIGFAPSEVWTRILSKVSDDSAKAILLYRLLREKPDLIVGSMHAVREGGPRVDIKGRIIQWIPPRTYH